MIGIAMKLIQFRRKQSEELSFLYEMVALKRADLLVKEDRKT